MSVSYVVALATGALAFASTSALADINISKGPTQNMSCSAGVCTATAKKATLNVTDLTNMLASGDVTVKSGKDNDTAAGIEIVDGFSWTSTSRLTLTARHNIIVKAKVVAAGTGALTLTYGTGNPDSDLLFEQNGKIDFWDTNSSLKINGGSYTLVRDLKTLAADIAQNRSGLYALANDYDASVDGTYLQSPIQADLDSGGAFEGLAHTIANLAIATKKNMYYLGLFSVLDYGSTVRDIRLSAASITMKKTRNPDLQGVLAGGSAATILHSFASGSVAGSNAGGLVGLNNGAISDSGADVTVSGLLRAGGLAASSNGSIVTSRSSGAVSVSGFGEAGGLVGGLGGTVDQSYATGSVMGTRFAVGGKCCENSFVGGLFGRNFGTISNSYATGSVSGIQEGIIGGISGLNSSGAQIVSSYSTGAVSVGGEADRLKLGGFVGHDQHVEFQNDYWDIDTSGQQQPCGSKCSGVTGVTDAELKSGLPAGFDPNIWGQSPSINNGYPYLLANPPPQ